MSSAAPQQPDFLRAAAGLRESPRTLRIEVIRDRAGLEAILPAWESLAADLLEPNPFYEPWIFLPALEAEGERGLLCVLIWIDGALCGLFPFARAPRYKGLPLGVLVSWRHSSFLLCTPLVRAGKAPVCLAALMDWLRKDGEGASAAEFRYLPGEGAFIGALADALRDAGSVMLPTYSFTRALLRKDASAEHYLRTALSRETRKALRRKERRLGERAQVSRVALQPNESPQRWIAEFLELEASGWKGRAGSAFVSRESSRRFATAVLTEAHRRGRLQLLGIDCGGRAIARCCNFIAGEGSYAFRAAYDEAYGYFSPGIMAEVESIRVFHELPGVQWMDSYTDPDNITIGRMWKHRRMMQSLLVAGSAWGEFWVSALPMLRFAGRRLAAVGPRQIQSKTTHSVPINAGIA